MPCDTCNATLESVGHLNDLWRVFHCPRCGTLVIEKRTSMVPGQGETRWEVSVPAAVRRARELLGTLWAEAVTLDEQNRNALSVTPILRRLKDLAEAVNGTMPPE